jgi:hypothetical protein
MKSVSDKRLTENKTYFAFNIFFENPAVYETMWKILYSWAGHRRQYGACAFYAGYLRLQTHTENM